MKCKNCNSQIPDTAAFCSNCGTPVDDDLEATGLLVEDDEEEATGLLVEEDDEDTGLLVENQVDIADYSATDNDFHFDEDVSQGNINPAFINPNANKSQFQNYEQSNSTTTSNGNSNISVIEKPSMKECYIKFWENTTNYSDRARRSEYWNVVLMNLIISLAASITVIGAPLMVLYSIACIPQTLSLLVRRLHDIGKEWYHLFFYLIPLAGPIIILVWLCKDSQVGTNEFGENPKGINS